MSNNAPFSPKGDVAEWRMIFDHIETLDYGAVVTHERLDEILGRDFCEDRAPIYRANREFEAKVKRSLLAVAGVGYRVATADETVDIVASRLKRSARQVRRGQHTGEHAPLDDMSSPARAALANVQARLARVEEAQRRTDRKADVALDGLADVKEALRRHGLDAAPPGNR